MCIYAHVLYTISLLNTAQGRVLLQYLYTYHMASVALV